MSSWMEYQAKLNEKYMLRFEIRPPCFQCTSLFILTIIHLRESPESKTTRVKHNCASLLQRLDISISHRDKHKTVSLCSLRLKKIRTNRTYVPKSQYAQHGVT